MEEKFRLPETTVATKNCLSKDFTFEPEARGILKKIGAIIQGGKPEADKEPYYVNNIIGIFGGRGSGKTSLIASILKTIKENKQSINIPEIERSRIICLTDLIDPKAIPDFIGIIDLVLALLFSYFKEKVEDIKEVARESLFQRFERLNKIVSILSQTQRTEVIENPGDLYDLASLVMLRKALEELVQDLLAAHNPPKTQSHEESQKKGVFIIAIDDFDLDSTNSLRMVYELSTFLNIKGLIFMLAMDPAIFDYEIERARIKELSDFGNPTNSILTAAPQKNNRLWRAEEAAMIQGKETLAKYWIGSIAESARKYRSHLSAKLIPIDFRFDMKAHDFVGNEDTFEERVDELSDWLFGFSRIDLPGKEKLLSVARNFCSQFREALVVTSNLRSRNQILNQILDLLEERESSQKAVGFSLANEYKELRFLSDALRDYPSFPIQKQKTEKDFLKKIAREIDRSITFADYQYLELEQDQINNLSDNITDGERNTSIYLLLQAFWVDHPCAYYAYQQIVSKIDSYDYEEFASMYLDLLSFYKDKMSETEKNGIHLQKSENGYEIGAVVLSAMSLHENLLAVDFRNISRDLRIMLNMLKSNSAKIVKRDALNLLMQLRDYFARKEGFPIVQLLDLNDLRKKLQRVPWTRDSEEKREVLEELQDQLEKLSKYLI